MPIAIIPILIQAARAALTQVVEKAVASIVRQAIAGAVNKTVQTIFQSNRNRDFSETDTTNTSQVQDMYEEMNFADEYEEDFTEPGDEIPFETIPLMDSDSEVDNPEYAQPGEDDVERAAVDDLSEGQEENESQGDEPVQEEEQQDFLQAPEPSLSVPLLSTFLDDPADFDTAGAEGIADLMDDIEQDMTDPVSQMMDSFAESDDDADLDIPAFSDESFLFDNQADFTL